MKKEELQKYVSKLELQIEVAKEQDKKIRKEFAKIFNMVKTDFYSKEKEPLELSWNEIFTEVGKLLQANKIIDFTKRINDIDNFIKLLAEDIKELQNKIK